MTRRAQPQLAAVRIGIDDFILPMADALRLVEIMGRARPAERRYSAGARWAVRQRDRLHQVDLTLVHERDLIELVDAEEVSPAPRRPLALPAPGGRS
jgi:hypothetical protein